MEEDLSGVATQESPASEASVGELVSRASEQLTTLVRDEMRLAQVEMAQKGRRSGIGLGLFGGAGAVAWFGIGSLVTAAILGLSRRRAMARGRDSGCRLTPHRKCSGHDRQARGVTGHAGSPPGVDAERPS